MKDEAPDQFELGRVRVLELIDEQVAKTSPNPRADLLFLAQQPHRQRDQIVEVDAARPAQFGLIPAIDRGDMAVEEVLGLALEGGGGQQPVLRRADPALDRARLKRPVVQVFRRESRLDQPQLVGSVHDREVGPQPDAVAVAAQQAHAEPVEGAHEDARVAADQVEGAFAHLVRGLVGEGHRRDPPGLDFPLGDQPGDPAGDDARLPRSSAGDHELGTAVVGDRRELLRVQPGTEVHIGHRRRRLTFF